MKQTCEDMAFEQRRQRQLDAEYLGPQLVPTGGGRNGQPARRPRIGTKVPFAKTVDRDPNPRIPLSVPVEVPRAWYVAATVIVATLLLVLTMWVS